MGLEITLPTWQSRRLGKDWILGNTAEKLPRPGTAFSQILLQESQTSSLSEPLLGGHLVACHPEPSEAEDIKKRWQEYREELYKKDLHDPDNHDRMITHLEPDILNAKSSGP